VIYEMMAGHAPFEGATASHIIVSILENNPPWLERHAGGVPAELERIVAKALAKDREGRYQTICAARQGASVCSTKLFLFVLCRPSFSPTRFHCCTPTESVFLGHRASNFRSWGIATTRK
jgi:hypothetical protein